MYSIKPYNKIAECGLEMFKSGSYSINEAETNPDAILVRSASLHEIMVNDNLLAVARAGAGVNNIPVSDFTEKGVVVFNTPGANANAVKELAIAALLLASRGIVDGINWTKTIADKGSEVPALVEKGKSAFAGPELKGKKLGVIGLGAIGVMVANTANHFGMQVLGYDPYMSVEAAWCMSRSVKHCTDLNELYSECDYISLHVPLNNETRGLFCETNFNSMKDGVRIINFSRGELVNNTDIAAALKSGKVACYVTDFPDSETVNMEGAICIPHLGASTPESEDNCARAACSQLADYLENGNIKNSVNLPNLVIPKSAFNRICVIHKNIPNKLTAITGFVSECGINIENMYNKSKGNCAYTVMETIDKVPEDTLRKIKEISDVMMVRMV